MDKAYKNFTTNPGRRVFFKEILLGSAAITLGSSGLMGCASSGGARRISRSQSAAEWGESRVSLVPGNDRSEIICESLRPFEKEIREGIGNKQVLIKLNCVRPNTEIVGTHRDAIRGVLEFLKPIYDRTVIVGEATSDKVNARGIYEHFGFLPLEKDYNIRFEELNDYPVGTEWVLDANMYPTPIKILSPFIDPNFYVISLAKLKTHNCVVGTLTLKNVVMGAPQKISEKKINERPKMHATSKTNNSPKMLNFNLFKLAHRVYPDLCVIDGFEGLQGNGPNEGTAVESRVALAGTDYVAVDRIGLELMGIPWENVGYLQYCATANLGQGDRSKIKIIGPDPRQYVKEYQLHKNIDWQYTWKDNVVLQNKQ